MQTTFLRTSALSQVADSGSRHTAEHIATVSRFSRTQLHRYRVASPNKTSVIGNGHEHTLGWRPKHSPENPICCRLDTVVVSLAPARRTKRWIAGRNGRGACAGEFALGRGRGYRHARWFAAGLASFNPAERGVPRSIDGPMKYAAPLIRQPLSGIRHPSSRGSGFHRSKHVRLVARLFVSDRSCLPEICGEAALSLRRRPTRTRGLKCSYAWRNDAELRATTC